MTHTYRMLAKGPGIMQPINQYTSFFSYQSGADSIESEAIYSIWRRNLWRPECVTLISFETTADSFYLPKRQLAYFLWQMFHGFSGTSYHSQRNKDNFQGFIFSLSYFNFPLADQPTLCCMAKGTYQIHLTICSTNQIFFSIKLGEPKKHEQDIDCVLHSSRI